MKLELKRPKRIPDALIAAGLITALTLTVALTAGQRKPAGDDQALQTGANYLANVAALDAGEVDELIYRRREEKVQQQAEEERNAALNEQLRQLETEDAEIWAKFGDAVILGDSRAVGFSYFHFLDRSRVLADESTTIRNISEWLPAIRTLNPSYVYICYGINDTGIGYWTTGEEYAAEFEDILKTVEDAAPHAKIIVSSILPTTERALAQNPVWNRMPDFCEKTKAMCEKNGYVFAENDALVKSHPEMYSTDGIHFLSSFYPLWAKNLLSAALRDDIRGGA
ncbi:MAG: hypothetical protein IJK02_12360 [Clostridia bacterium]|nr:hypothetical protein [Clostridia bacterium]